MAIVIFILILSFLVIIHELGHFLAAKWAGMNVEEFGLGYPPRALKLFTWKNTLFSLNWIPFGGFVRIEGEDEANGEFNHQPVFKRLVVILAGATVNFLFGIIAFAIIFSISGIPISLDQPRIGEVVENSPAAEAQLPTNVAIQAIKVDDQRINTSTIDQVIDTVEEHRGQTVEIITTGPCDEHGNLCDHQEQYYQAYLRTAEETPDGQGSLGITFQTVIYQFYPWYETPFRAAWYGIVQAVWLGQLILQSLGQLVTDMIGSGAIPQDVAGPVGIVDQAGSSGIFTEGILAVLSFAGMLSINLAIMNVLPIPALDGGRAVFILLEKVLGKHKIAPVEEYANFIGYILLLMLIIAITIKDVINLFV